MIPKTLFLYWGGRLSWLRYLTVVSFAKHNPAWAIKVYYPVQATEGSGWPSDEQLIRYRGQDFFSKLSEYAELIPFDMAEVGMSNEMSEVHKSDVFRLWALNKFGGVYSDFDILYTKPMPNISRKKLVYCYHPNGHYSIGLLASAPGDTVIGDLLQLSKSAIGNKYQTFGSTLWGRGLEGVRVDGWNLPRDFIYSYYWDEVDQLFLESKGLPEEAYGVHWYGGSQTAGRWESVLGPGVDNSSTIGNVIKGVVCSQ